MPGTDAAGSVAAGEDERLVREFLSRGEVAVFEQLVRRHQRSVCRIAMSVLGPGHETQAEDVAQEVFLDVYRKLGGFEGRSRFSTWLYRIAYRRAIDRTRMPYVRREVSLPETAVADGAPADPLRDRAVQDCVERLPDAQRSAVRLHYWLGAGVDEIATLLGTRPGTVKSWLFRARELVAQCLAAKGVNS